MIFSAERRQTLVTQQIRLGKVRSFMTQQGLSALFFRDQPTIAWITAFDGVFDSEDAHALLVTDEGAILHTDSRYAQAMQQACEGMDVSVSLEAKRHAEWAIDELACAHDDSAAHTCVLGVEDALAIRDYRILKHGSKQCERSCSLKLLEDPGMRLRAVKDSHEIARMKQAQEITDAAFAHILGVMRPGMTERAVQLELDEFMRRHGASDLAFPTIVATGAHAASPHELPGETVLQQGDCVVMDFGACFGGYCSDMTRTVSLGRPSQRIQAAYTAIREANEAVERLIKPGVTGKACQDMAEAILEQHGFGGCMGHSLGHGVGRQIHELPVLASRNEEGLHVGNVVTVEPGIYVSGEFGMRLEDFGAVTETGFDIFTRSAHDMVII